MTLGSLFDGSGTCPLAATICGITPVWASEIEPFPVAVTTKRFPNMKHLGDLTKINGAEIEPVDIITFGSPCQDLSIAGKRAGLNGDRSSLFFHAIRIVKEMREKTNGKYPRFAVYENVLGAFSSNSGEDFREVLRQFCQVCDPSADVPRPDNGKWLHDGCIMGESYSVAWRVLDAQYWGVAARRRRLYAVLDLTGGSAPKVLFEREGLQRDFDKIRETWKTSPGNIKESTIKHDSVVGHTVIGAFESHSQDARYTPLPKVCSTLNAQYGTGGNNMPLVTELAYTMQLRAGCDGGGKGALIQIEKSATLSTVQTQTLFQPVTSCLTPWDTQGRRCYDENGIFPTLQARENAGGNQQTVLTAKDSQFIVRRLTPQECAMLQGFPADWAADIPHSDSAEYKMWGNGMALPCMLYIMEGLAAELSEEADNGTSS